MATRRIAQINLSLEFKICVDGGRAPSVLMPMVAVPHLDCCLLGGALFNFPRIKRPEAMRSAVVATTQRASDTMCVPEQDVKDGESKLRVGCLRFATGLPRVLRQPRMKGHRFKQKQTAKISFAAFMRKRKREVEAMAAAVPSSNGSGCALQQWQGFIL